MQSLLAGEGGEEELPTTRPQSAAKARELASCNVLVGEELPAPPAAPASVKESAATAKSLSQLTQAELRTALRSRGLSPAGCKATLEERLLAALRAGAPPLLLPTKQFASGLASGTLSAAYARADGAGDDSAQARKDAASSGVAAVLGGAAAEEAAPAPRASAAALAQRASHILGGGEEEEAAARGVKANARRATDSAGNSVFTPALPPAGPGWSALKASDYAGNDIFAANASAPRHSATSQRSLAAKQAAEAAAAAAAKAAAGAPEELLGVPTFHRSTLKSSDYAGSGIFGKLPAAAPSPPPMALSESKRAEMRSSVFSEAEGQRPRRRSAGDAYVREGPQAAGRARDSASSWLTQAHLAAAPAPAPSASRAHRCADLHTAAGDGTTMAFASSVAAAGLPRPASAGGLNRSAAGRASSFALG